MKEIGVSLEDISVKVQEYAWDSKARVTSGGRDARWALAALMKEGLSPSRFNDKIVLCIANKEGIPLVTFDRKLRAQAQKENIIVLPRSIT